MSKPKKLPALSVLKDRFTYCEGSGLLQYRVKINGTKFGAPVGCASDRKYLHTRISGNLYYSHRIIWKMCYGEDPHGEIDHIDHDRQNNRLSNLRVVSPRGNSKNRSMRSDNKSGVTGVYWDKKSQKWWAEITPYGESIYLGHFTDKSDAIAIRKSAEVKHDFHANHGRTV